MVLFLSHDIIFGSLLCFNYPSFYSILLYSILLNIAILYFNTLYYILLCYITSYCGCIIIHYYIIVY